MEVRNFTRCAYLCPGEGKKTTARKHVMSIIKRTFSLFLAMLLLTASLSCAKSEAISSEGAQETTPVETEPTVPAAYLPTKKYDGQTVKILTSAEQWIRTYDADLTGDQLDDAVYKRNLAVEERFGVDLDYVVFNGYSAGMAATKEALTATMVSGDMEYDLLAADGYYVGAYAFDNLILPLDNISVLDFTREHYFTETTENHRLYGNTYLVAGYWSVNSLRQLMTLFYNKSLGADLGIDSVYEDVNSGKWTWDRMTELAMSAVMDLDGDGKMTADDRFGLVSTVVDTMGYFATSMDFKYMTSQDGTLTLTLFNERLSDINDRVYNFINSNAVHNTTNDSSDGQTYLNIMLSSFATGNALFMLYRLDMTEQETIRNMEDYGLLPLPKFNEEQAQYYSAGGCDVGAIPAQVKDAEMSAILMDALSAYGFSDVLPVYYDVVLSNKYARDQESRKMLDLICKGTFTDPILTYATYFDGGLYMTLGTTSNLASTYEKKYSAITAKLEKAQKSLQE